jgi:hypothetical protein
MDMMNNKNEEKKRKIAGRENNSERLEDRVKNDKNRGAEIFYLRFEKYPKNYSNFGVNTVSGATVINVPGEFMPKRDNGRVLGLYNTLTHTIYISNDETKEVRDFVYYHEEAHSLGEYDEEKADEYAERKLGSNPLRYAA